MYIMGYFRLYINHKKKKKKRKKNQQILIIPFIHISLIIIQH